MTSRSKLADKRILVFGGSSGIGYHVAALCLAEGAFVAICSSNADKRLAAVEKLHLAVPDSHPVEAFPIDLTNRNELDTSIASILVAATQSLGGLLHHIVFTAGDRLTWRPLRDATLDWVESIGLVRFVAPVLLAKHAPQYMASGPGSSVTVTGGSVGDRPVAAASVISGYCAAVDGLVRGLSRELAPLRFNVVAPGAVETGHLYGHGEVTDERRREVRERFVPHTTTGELGRPEDVAEAFLYIMKDPGVVGAVIKTSGGRLVT